MVSSTVFASAPCTLPTAGPATTSTAAANTAAFIETPFIDCPQAPRQQALSPQPTHACHSQADQPGADDVVVSGPEGAGKIVVVGISLPLGSYRQRYPP